MRAASESYTTEKYGFNGIWVYMASLDDVNYKTIAHVFKVYFLHDYNVIYHK